MTAQKDGPIALDDLFLKRMDPNGESLVLMYGKDDNLVFVAPQMDDRFPDQVLCFSVACVYQGGHTPYYEERVMPRKDARHFLAELVVEEGLVLLSEADDMHPPRTVTLTGE